VAITDLLSLGVQLKDFVSLASIPGRNACLAAIESRR
jgi:hypothetical protein